MKKYLIFIIFVIFTIFLIALSCSQPGGGGGGGGGDKKEPPPIVGFIFPGGTEVDTFGFIDVNDNGVLDNGDPFTYESNININGNQKVTFQFPDDFVLCSNSGSISVNLVITDLSYPEVVNKTFYCGSNPYKVYPPASNSLVINSQNFTLPLLLDGETLIFYGGAEIGAGGFIDMNDNGVIDDGDYIAGNNIEINGNINLITLNYPDNFQQIINSGSISVNLLGANDDCNGKTYYCGAVDPEGYSISTNNSVITSNNITLPLQSSGATIKLPGGSVVDVGGFIDINNNGIIDNGDCGAGGIANINGDVIIPFNFPDDFEIIENSGYISINLLDANDDCNGIKFYYGSFHVMGINAKVKNMVINSNNMTLYIK